MKIEELMPQIRAGKKVRLAVWHKDDYMYLVDNYVAAEHHEFGDTEPYTGIIYKSKGREWLTRLGGEHLLRDDWELYDEPAQPV